MSDETPREVRDRSGATARDAAQIKMGVVEILRPFDAMHLLALIADVSAATVPSDFSMPILPQAVVEYFATVLLERTDPAGTANPANTPAFREAAERAIVEIERLMSLTLEARMIESGWAADPLKQLAADIAFRETVFRWTSYPDQERRALAELFGLPEVSKALVRELGFSSEDALKLHEAMDRLTLEKRHAHARVIERFVEENATAPQIAELDDRGRRMLAVALQLGPDLVDAWVVTETELSMASGKRWQVCHAYLRLLCSHFGDVKGTNLAEGRNLVRRRPLVTDDDQRYLPTSIDDALRALRPAFEEALPEAVFDGFYQSHRARWVEERVLDAIRTALPKAQTWQNLRFDLDGVLNYEVDVLVRLDTLCIVVEVKSGRVRSGGRDLRRALEGLLGKASEQAGRLARAISAGRTPAFREIGTEASVSVGLDGVTRVEPMIVTLENLGWLASRRSAMRELGLITQDDGTAPWVVSVFDLEVIAELSRHPAELTRYMALRHHLDERVLAVDELELWLLYIDQSIDFTSVDATMIMLTGRLGRYDDAKLLGKGKLPRLKLARKPAQQLRELSRKTEDGWLDRSEALIAEVQSRRPPTAFLVSQISGLAICAPQDPGLRPQIVGQLLRDG